LELEEFINPRVKTLGKSVKTLGKSVKTIGKSAKTLGKSFKTNSHAAQLFIIPFTHLSITYAARTSG